MKTLKLVWLTFIQLVKQVCLIPKTIARLIREKRQQAILDKREAERLDRICNPIKYRGK